VTCVEAMGYMVLVLTCIRSPRVLSRLRFRVWFVSRDVEVKVHFCVPFQYVGLLVAVVYWP
jgi:hypothetical protein